MGGPGSVTRCYCKESSGRKHSIAASLPPQPLGEPAEGTWKGTLPQRRGHTTDQALRKDLAPSDAESSDFSHQVQVSTADFPSSHRPPWQRLTLLTRMSVASKCLPYILGDSPGIGSILTQTSCPFFATSTCLWFISMLVTIPMSTN